MLAVLAWGDEEGSPSRCYCWLDRGRMPVFGERGQEFESRGVGWLAGRGVLAIERRGGGDDGVGLAGGAAGGEGDRVGGAARADDGGVGGRGAGGGGG